MAKLKELENSPPLGPPTYQNFLQEIIPRQVLSGTGRRDKCLTPQKKMMHKQQTAGNGHINNKVPFQNTVICLQLQMLG